jgi:hypothetical protein
MGEAGPHQTQPKTEETPKSKPNGSSSPSRRKPIRSSVWVLNSLLGASTVVIGSHDVLSPRAAERATGAVFFIAGLVLTVSAIWTLTAQHANDKARDLALGGFVLGLIPGATLAFIQFSSYGYSRRALFWLLAAAIPVLGAMTLWRKEGARLNFFQATSSVTLLAAGITLLPPLLGSAFRPVVDPTIVDAQMDMEVVGRRHDSKRGDVAVIACKLTIKNIGKRRLMFVGSLYSVQGIDSKQRKSSSEADWPMASELRDRAWSGRFESPWDETTVAEVGYDFFSPGDILEPGQQVVVTFLPIVPDRQYDTVEAYATVATAFDDRLRLGDQIIRVEEQTLEQETPVEAIWEIEPTSWVAWLTQGWQDLRVAYGMDIQQNRFTGLYIELGTGRDLQRQQTSPRYNPRAFTTYGLGWTTASDSVVLDATSP